MLTCRSHITLAVCAVVGWSALAVAQNPPDVECKKTETQPECHARLKCKPNEELEECQRRLLKCTAGEALDACKKRASAGQGQGNAGNANQGNAGNANQGNAGNADQGRDDGRRRGDNGGGDDGRRRGDNGDDGRRRGDNGDEGRRRSDNGGGETRVQRRSAAGGGTPFASNKTFGLGLELGEPSGLTGKVFVSDKSAIDFGLGYIYDDYYYGDGVHIYGDYLYHPVSLASTQAFELPLYIGGGLRYWKFDYCFMRVCDFGGSALGIRVPLGLAFDFNNTPLDIFIQLVPVLDFLYGDYYTRFGDRTHLAIDLSVGLRYYFK